MSMTAKSVRPAAKQLRGVGRVAGRPDLEVEALLCEPAALLRRVEPEWTAFGVKSSTRVASLEAPGSAPSSPQPESSEDGRQQRDDPSHVAVSLGGTGV